MFSRSFYYCFCLNLMHQNLDKLSLPTRLNTNLLDAIVFYFLFYDKGYRNCGNEYNKFSFNFKQHCHCCLVSYLAGWLVVYLVGWLVGWLV